MEMMHDISVCLYCSTAPVLGAGSAQSAVISLEGFCYTRQEEVEVVQGENREKTL